MKTESTEYSREEHRDSKIDHEKQQSEDEVIARFNVYLTPSLSSSSSSSSSSTSLQQNIHIFQFPLRSRNTPYEANKIRLYCANNIPQGNHQEHDSQARSNSDTICSSSRLTMRLQLDTFASNSFNCNAKMHNSNNTNDFDYNDDEGDTYYNQSNHNGNIAEEDEIGGNANINYNNNTHRSYDHRQPTRYEYALHSQPFASRSRYVVACFSHGGLYLLPVSTLHNFYPLISHHNSNNLKTHFSTDSLAQEDTQVAQAARVPDEFCSITGSSININNSSNNNSTRSIAKSSTRPVVSASPSPRRAPVSLRVEREMMRQFSVMLNTSANQAMEFDYLPSTSSWSRQLRQRLLDRTPLESITTKTTHYSPPLSSIGAIDGNTHRVWDALFPPEILLSGGITGGEDYVAISTFIHTFANRYSLTERVRQLMQRCQVLPLSTLAQTLTMSVKDLNTPTQVTNTNTNVNTNATRNPLSPSFLPITIERNHFFEQLVGLLRQCAVYMHGVWVARSSDQFRGSSGALREWILSEFYKSNNNGVVYRRELNAQVHSSALRKGIKKVLESIAVLEDVQVNSSAIEENEHEEEEWLEEELEQELESSKMQKQKIEKCQLESERIGEGSTRFIERRQWRLKHVRIDPSTHESEAEQFARTFPEVVRAEQENWAKRVRIIHSHLSYFRVNRVPPRLFLLTNANLEEQGTARSTAPSTMMHNSNYTMNGSNLNVNNSFLVHNSDHSYDARSMASTTHNLTNSGSNNVSSFSANSLLPITRYITSLFAEHGVLNKQRAKELVLQGRKTHYGDATNAMLSAALQSCVQSFTSSTWVLHELGEPGVDRYRPIILNVLRGENTFIMRHIQDKVREAIRESGDASLKQINVHRSSTNISNDNKKGISDADDALITRAVQRVVSEVAEYRTSERLWHIKTGHVMNL